MGNLKDRTMKCERAWKEWDKDIRIKDRNKDKK